MVDRQLIPGIASPVWQSAGAGWLRVLRTSVLKQPRSPGCCSPEQRRSATTFFQSELSSDGAGDRGCDPQRPPWDEAPLAPSFRDDPIGDMIPPQTPKTKNFIFPNSLPKNRPGA